MKKAVSLLFVFLICFGLFGCNENALASSADSEQESQSASLEIGPPSYGRTVLSQAEAHELCRKSIYENDRVLAKEAYVDSAYNITITSSNFEKMEYEGETYTFMFYGYFDAYDESGYYRGTYDFKWLLYCSKYKDYNDLENVRRYNELQNMLYYTLHVSKR